MTSNTRSDLPKVQMQLKKFDTGPRQYLSHNRKHQRLPKATSTIASSICEFRRNQQKTKEGKQTIESETNLKKEKQKRARTVRAN
jgi:hypothetical protein